MENSREKVTKNNSKSTNEALEDIVSNRYIINISTLMDEFSNIFCRVYKVNDTRQASNNSDNNELEYLAYVFNSSLPFRIRAFNLLQHYQEEDVIKPLVFNETFFSPTKSKHFTIITYKPKGLNLTEYVAQNGPVSESFLSDIFLPSVVKIFQNLDSIGLSHGSLSPNNIYINDKTITLGECFSTAPGFTQPSCYESIERMTTHPLGKGEPDILTDIFSIGMVCLFLITGQDPRNIAEPETMSRNRLALSSYQFFIASFNNISNKVRDLLKGLLSDKRNDRWKLATINDWVNNRKYTVLNISDNSDASRNLIFNSKHYINYRSLAFALSQEWEASKIFLKEDTLIKWAETSLADTDKAEKLHYLLRSNQPFYSSTGEEKDENVAKTILILNPESPICFKDIATHIDGIPFLFAYTFSQGKRELIDSLIKIIIYGLWKGSNINLGTNHRQEMIVILENFVNFVDKKGFGFGLERYLYEICPNLSCQSKILEGNYINSLESLLLFLDKKAHEKNDIEIMDNHIAAYIASKLKINNEIRISNHQEFTRFEKSRELLGLFLLSNAQKATKGIILKGISELMVKNLKPTLELIYNRKTKEDLSNKLQIVKDKGDLTEIFKIIANPQYIKNDREGFNEAAIQYNKLREKLEIISQPNRIYEIGYKYGLKLSVILSYLVTLFALGLFLTNYFS